MFVKYKQHIIQNLITPSQSHNIRKIPTATTIIVLTDINQQQHLLLSNVFSVFLALFL